jgi:hypothetical protein
VRRTQLSESPASAASNIGLLHCVGQHFEDLVIAPEVGEVFERQVDRPHHRAGAAQVAKLVGLSLSQGHCTTIHPRADAALHSD